jgi:hypothetical protein
MAERPAELRLLFGMASETQFGLAILQQAALDLRLVRRVASNATDSVRQMLRAHEIRLLHRRGMTGQANFA